MFLFFVLSQSSSSSSSKSSSSSDSDSDAKSEISETWDSSSDSESESDSDSDDEGADNKYAQLKGRAKWLKKVPVQKVQKVKREKTTTVEKQVEEKVVEEKKEETITAAVLNRKCRELVRSRGKRGTDAKTILSKLESLSKMAVDFGPRIEVPILMHVMTAQFDLVRTLDDSMDLATWQACAGHLKRVTDVLEGGAEKYTLTTETEDDELMIGNVLKGDNKMKDAAGVGGDMGAMDAVAATKKLINPHTVCVERYWCVSLT